jgi:hypothetical protein
MKYLILGVLLLVSVLSASVVANLVYLEAPTPDVIARALAVQEIADPDDYCMYKRLLYFNITHQLLFTNIKQVTLVMIVLGTHLLLKRDYKKKMFYMRLCLKERITNSL